MLQTARPFISACPKMRQLDNIIHKAAQSTAPVLIIGETGSGKERVAQRLHYESKRKKNILHTINIAALPETLIESSLFGHTKGAFTSAEQARKGAIASAENGSLFLDEIGEMPLGLQAKMLRLMEDGSYLPIGSDIIYFSNARIITATNRNLPADIKNNQFRSDLYHRLAVITISVPPLRDRRDDIIPLARFLINEINQLEQKKFIGLDVQAIRFLKDYDWPGNIRELKNTLRSAIALHDGDMITFEMLPPLSDKMPAATSATQDDLILPLEMVEKNAIQKTMRFTKGDVQEAASLLKVSASTLYRKLEKWRIPA